jgi:hypothetical protein
MANYYEVVVNAARTLGNHRATKSEIEKLAKRMFGYVGRFFDDSAFSKSYTEFRKSRRKIDRLVYA